MQSTTDSTTTTITLPVLDGHPDCTRCDLHEQATSPGIPTVHYTCSLTPNPSTPALFVIGQNPGFHEDRQATPFVGRSGDILKKSYLGGLDFCSRCSVYLGNGVRCHTTNNQTPKPKNYRECNQYLLEDLQALAAVHDQLVILTLGAPATASFYKDVLGQKRVSLTESFGLNGTAYADHHIEGVGELTMFSTYHPAAVMRNHNHINSVHAHMQLVSDFLDGTMATPSEPEIIPTRSPKTW